MPPLDTERREVADIIRRERGIENALTPAQARLFVRCLQTSWKVPSIAWTERESHTQFDDALRLMHAADIFRDLDGDNTPAANECYRRAGELFEWLSRARDSVTQIAPVSLYAAGAYQLGGLPAMATSLLRQTAIVGDTGVLLAEFLRADFDSVLATCASFWRRHPNLTSRTGSSAILTENRDDQVAWFLVVELVRAMGVIADCLRRGDADRIVLALQKLRGIEALSARSTGEEAWTLLALLRATADRYAKSSLHSRMQRLAETAPTFTPKLRHFAREQFARGRGILWTSQIHGLERLIVGSSFALCTPTGSGKTLIANLALVKELLLSPANDVEAPLALYLVPSRALAGEVETKLASELGRDLVITGLYGGSDWGVTDYWLTANRPTVLIATVEKADALMRLMGPLLTTRLRLLIIDEAHQVVPEDDVRAATSLAEHSSRSMRLESLVSRLLALKPNLVRIALTAVAGGAATPVARWVEGRIDAQAVGTNYRSTRQLIGGLLGTPSQIGRIVLDQMNGRPLYVRGRDDPLYLSLRIPAMPQLPASARNSLNHYNELHVLWTALHLLDGSRRILISIAQEPELTMRWFAEAFDLPGWSNLGTFELPEDEDLRVRFHDTRASCVDYCGANSYEVALLDRGIATSHGQMPQRLRRLMTDLIERRVCAITVATATLTEGVNLPFDLIFVTEIKRTSFDSATNQIAFIPFTTSEFRNLAGRAGRPGAAEAMEGMTLVALPQRPSTTAASQRDAQRRQVQRFNADYADLLNRLAVDEAEQDHVQSPLALLLKTIATRAVSLFNFNEEQFLTWLEITLPEVVASDVGMFSPAPQARLADSMDELDGFLLTAVEEVSNTQNSGLNGAAAEVFLHDLWARTFTKVAAVQEEWLERAFVKRGRAIIERLYPSADQRRKLYQYGFTPCIGRRFESIAPSILAEIERARDYGTMEPAERLAIFRRIGELLHGAQGFGFRVRTTVRDQAILQGWANVLAWWMQAPTAPYPERTDLRYWQRFVADNLEFRLGMAVGAVVADAWAAGIADRFQTPTLETWTATTHLPWFGFWCRELLRWGTLEPFIAFALSQGLARTREEAAQRRPEFEVWLTETVADPDPDDFINPQHFIKWQSLLPASVSAESVPTSGSGVLTGTDGSKMRYGVLPIADSTGVTWVDAGGFSLARSQAVSGLVPESPYRHDYDLIVGTTPELRRVFTAK